MKILVVYYSSTGNTRKIAEELADALECDIEEIIDMDDLADASEVRHYESDDISQKPTIIKETVNDPANFELLVIGTPVWNMNMSAPIRTYITQNQARFNNVAFFATAMGPNFDITFKAMKELSGITPISTLGVRAREIVTLSYNSKIKQFIKKIQQ
ncbi:MAG: flavodoxin family protein [Methanobacteriaceae archaeon]